MAPHRSAVVFIVMLGCCQLSWSAALGLYAMYYMFFCVQTPKLVYKKSNDADVLLARCPHLQRPYYPLFWLPEPNLQLAFYLFREILTKTLGGNKYLRQQFTLSDGGIIGLDWKPHTPEKLAALSPRTPTILIMHGVCGHSDDLAVAECARSCASNGWRVVVMVRRGHAGLKLETPRYNIFGDTHDLQEVIRHIHGRFPLSPVGVVGFSAGSALCMRYLGEKGTDSEVFCGIAVSPGYDISVCCSRVTPFWGQALLARMKRHFLLPNREVLSSHDRDTFDACMNAKHCHDFVAQSSPFSGYSNGCNWEHYLTRNNPTSKLSNISVPVLIINAMDDPISVEENILDHEKKFANLDHCVLAMLDKGSHCCFFNSSGTGTWLDGAVTEFVAAALERYEGRL